MGSDVMLFYFIGLLCVSFGVGGFLGASIGFIVFGVGTLLVSRLIFLEDK